MRHPQDKPHPPGGPKRKAPGGHAEERLREFIDQRFTEGQLPGAEKCKAEKDDENEGKQEEKGSKQQEG